MTHKKKFLTASTIALINVSVICNIKNFPLLAEYGFSIIFYLILSALFFFIPVAFISSELTSTWPDRGIYTWVKEALGERLGFLAIWLQWIENVIWYPTILSFIAGTFAYLINPYLATQKMYVVCAILTTFWSLTFINFLGMRVSGWISAVTALFGTIIPIALIILLSAAWLFIGHPSQINLSWKELIPNLTSANELVLLSGVILGLAGMEMSAVHARDVCNPRSDYPKAIFLSALLILVFSTLGALSIASIVPFKKIELASGSMEAFSFLFQAFQIPWGTPVISCIVTFGALGMISSWIVGPSRGLLATAEHGNLPPFFQKKNKHGMPVNVLLTQAIIVTLLSLVFLFMPSINSSYWILVALASILYQMMYFLMFISAIKLRYKHPHIERPYKVPFGKAGIWTASILGIIGSSFAFFVGFFPPSQFNVGKTVLYDIFLLGGSIIFCAIPLLIFNTRKPSWHTSGSHHG